MVEGKLIESAKLTERVRMERKMRIVNELFQIAYETKRFQIRNQNPHLTQQEVNHRAYALIEKGCK